MGEVKFIPSKLNFNCFFLKYLFEIEKVPSK